MIYIYIYVIYYNIGYVSNLTRGINLRDLRNLKKLKKVEELKDLSTEL